MQLTELKFSFFLILQNSHHHLYLFNARKKMLILILVNTVFLIQSKSKHLTEKSNEVELLYCKENDKLSSCVVYTV